MTKDSSTCLACVYLNEYKVAVAAFTLHASENKLVRVGPHSSLLTPQSWDLDLDLVLDKWA